jgi:hypothetical protein
MRETKVQKPLPSLYCRQCGYQLAGLSENRCPECGQTFDPNNSETFALTPDYWRQHRWLPAVLASLVVAVVLAAMAISIFLPGRMVELVWAVSFVLWIGFQAGILVFEFWAWQRFALASMLWLAVHTLVGFGLIWEPYVLRAIINRGVLPASGPMLNSYRFLGSMSGSLALAMLAGLVISDFLFYVQQRGYPLESPFLKAALSLRERSTLLGGLMVAFQSLPALVLLRWWRS